MRALPCRRTRSDPAVIAAVAAHGRAGAVALPVLQTVQAAGGGFLDSKVLGATADALQVSDARIYGIASFYSLLSTRPRSAKVIRVCDGPVCMLRGGAVARAAFDAVAPRQGFTVERCSCLGLCDRAPAALVESQPCGPIGPETVGAILDGWVGETPTYTVPQPGEVRVALARIGRIDPDSIDSAVRAGAYRTLAAAFADGPNRLLDTLERSGLRGCGGAGFPTGRKWRMVAEAGESQKYVVCNADESEPGTFKDRVLMEGDPHLLLEGLALAGYAVGAGEGVIYVRGEYEWIARLLERAVAQAAEKGWLGTNIHGSRFSFRVHVHRGAGAYICGEETALLESLEGKRGEPRARPPYPTTCGLNGKPTVVNNVETLCLAAAVIVRGADWFRSLGTASSPGTKVFTASGCVNRPGAFEAPMGITLRQIVEHFGGGMLPGSTFKAALTGGAAGTIVPAALLDVPLDFASGDLGVALGSGGMVILDQTVSIPTFLTWLLHFFEVESCGKCTPCREGTREARLLCERIAAGQGRPGDVAELGHLARLIRLTSFCGLGQSVAGPIESALHHFREEFSRNQINA